MSPSATRPDCYKCVHRRGLAGNSHSACAHPSISGAAQDPMAQLMAVMVPQVSMAAGSARRLGVVGDPHGIARGWFAWPLNFDPTWLRACNGFEDKPITQETTR
ncbi:MAG: hypothetical protein KGL39_30340 [Patescibacteria group bacterium]|nr:hypothetical protein [Patescibacteria group bacterium]